MKEPSIEITRQFKGHTASINSLAVHPSLSSSPLFLSGSDDGTARIWDIRVSASTSSQACCTTPGPVTAVAWDTNKSGCFVASETVLLWYDLRMERVTQIFESMDEINQIVSSPCTNTNRKSKKQKKNKKNSNTEPKSIPTVACADDTGQVNLWSQTTPNTSNSTTASWQHCRMLSHSSDDTLVLSCALDEHAKYLVTGTSDCFVRLWSWTTGQLLSQSSVTAVQQEQQRQQQLCNPPMIHTLTWMPSFPCFVAGCGDGSLAIGNAQGVWLSRVDAAHGASVAACCPFGNDPEWGCLASTGNDGRIVLWEMQSLLLSSRESRSKTNNTDGNATNSSGRDWLYGARDSGDISELNDAIDSWSLKQEPQTLLAWDHVRGMNKPNDMVHSETALFLADTSPTITMYTIRPGD